MVLEQPPNMQQLRFWQRGTAAPQYARTVSRRLFCLLCCLVALPWSLWPETPAVAYKYANVQFVGGGFITGFVAHPAERGLRYVRTDIGGAYRWDEAEKHWTPLLDWLPMAERNLMGIESVAVDPTDPKKLYLAAGTYLNNRTPNGAVLRSSDQGRHFEIVHVPFRMGGNEDGRFAGERLQVDPNHPQSLLLGTRLDGLWGSIDAGISWHKASQFPGVVLNNDGLTFVAYDKGSGRAGQPTPVIFVGLANPAASLLRSDDAGRTWKTVPGSPLGVFPNHGVFAADGTLYLSYTDAEGPNGIGNGAVWAYTPRTGKWRDVTPEKPGRGGAQGFGYGVVAVDAQHAGTLLASTMDRWHSGDTIFRSTDSGAHWSSLKEGAERDPALAPWTAHTRAQPLHAGAQPTHTLDQPPFGHWIGAAMIDPFDPAHVLYGTGETIWESHDALAAKTHWSVGAAGLEETADIALLSPALPGDEGPHLYSGLGDIGCFRNDDFSKSPGGGAMKNPEFSNCDALALAAGKPQEMARVGRSWMPGSPHGAVSHDGGEHWTPFPSEPAGGERGGSLAISANGQVLLWAVRGGPLAMSRDAGAHWRTLSPASNEKLPLAVFADARTAEDFWVWDPATGELHAIAADGAARLVSKGPGDLTAKSGGKGARLAMAPQAPGTLWLAGDKGLWRSADAGAHWSAVSTVAAAYAVGFGKAGQGGLGGSFGPQAKEAPPVIYLAGALAGTPEAQVPKGEQTRGGGLYRSLDDGGSWQRMDDPAHRFATVEQIIGDPRVFGRVYVGTNGRGVFWGEPAGR